jgi:hypothetical protein
MASQTVKFEYDEKNNILFTVDDYEVKTREDAERFFDLYRQEIEQIGKKVHLVTKIDGLYIDPTLDEYYGQVAKMVSQKWFLNFARYGDTAVGRMGIMNAATKAHFVTSIHKTRNQAVAAVLAGGT